MCSLEPDGQCKRSDKTRASGKISILACKENADGSLSESPLGRRWNAPLKFARFCVDMAVMAANIKKYK
jgi:hypothetical protein